MQHAWKHVERPGGSHTALEGKKNRSVRFTLCILGGNEWVRFPRHSVSGSILLWFEGLVVWKGYGSRVRLVLRAVLLFFRPTPYGFRQVVQHVSKHVAFGIN